MTTRQAFEEWIVKMIHYNPETGKLYWKESPSASAPVGKEIGKENSWGHVSFGMKGKTFMAHRVAWFLTFGSWPKGQIDHINGIASDNRISNLRDVSQSVNMQNKKRANKQNKSGFLGVNKINRNLAKPWRACIKAGGKSISIGLFRTPEEAHAAYMNAKRNLHAGFVEESS